jgi:hypothetical protein
MTIVTNMDMRQYHGTCHCGAFRFKAALNNIDSALTCDCAACRKTGFLWAEVWPRSIIFLRGKAADLTKYDTGYGIHEVGQHCWSLSCTTFWLSADADYVLCSSARAVAQSSLEFIGASIQPTQTLRILHFEG